MAYSSWPKGLLELSTTQKFLEIDQLDLTDGNQHQTPTLALNNPLNMNLWSKPLMQLEIT